MANIWRIHLRKGSGKDGVPIGDYCIKNRVAAMGFRLKKHQDKIKNRDIIVRNYNDYENYAKLEDVNYYSVRLLAQEVKPGDFIWTRIDGIFYLAKINSNCEYHYNYSDEAFEKSACNELTNVDWKRIGDDTVVDTDIIKKERFARGQTLCRLFNPEDNRANFDLALKYTQNIYNKSEQFLFGYKVEPAYGCDEVTEGYSFMIQPDGTAVYNRFVMSGRQLSSETIQIENNIIAELKEYLCEKEPIIKKLPRETYNHSDDGAFNTFTFLGKSMTSLNATICPIESPKNEFEKQMIPVLQAENDAIEIFLGGINILKKSNTKFSVKSWEEFEFWSIDEDSPAK